MADPGSGIGYRCRWPEVDRGGRVHDVPVDRPRKMAFTRTMAGFAPDVPFGRHLGLDVVVDRVTPITQRSCGALHLIVRVEVSPPVGARFRMIPSPLSVANIPLSGEHKEVIPVSGEVTLLPLAPVRERDVIGPKRDQWILRVEVGQNCGWSFERILQHVGHQRVLPPCVDVEMTVPAGRRPDECPDGILRHGWNLHCRAPRRQEEHQRCGKHKS